MPTIQIKKTGEEPGAASLAVTVPVEQVQEAEARATTAYQRRARLPGFRKGKAPAALVKRQFAEDIRQQTLEDLIRESWKAALAQEALKPIADPHIHNLKWDASAGGPVTFEFHVEVKPEITLERIGKFHLKRTTPKVTEDQVLPHDRRPRGLLLPQRVQLGEPLLVPPLGSRALQEESPDAHDSQGDGRPGARPAERAAGAEGPVDAGRGGQAQAQGPCASDHRDPRG